MYVNNFENVIDILYWNIKIKLLINLKLVYFFGFVY